MSATIERMELSAEPTRDIKKSTGPRVKWALKPVRNTDRTGQSISVESPLPFTIGRNVGCSVQLKSNTVSGAHAELRPHNDELWIRDLQSTNGTFVNRQRIESPRTIGENDLIQFADIAFRVTKNEERIEHQTMLEDVCDQALALVQFDRLMVERLVTPAYQPIVNLVDGAVIGVEVLARSTLVGIESPAAMFAAAARANMEVELSRLLRWEGVHQASSVRPDLKIFLNTHPLEIQQPGLVDSLEQLRAMAPHYVIVLEVHEAAIADPAQMKTLKNELAALDIQLAYDDFGSGQTRLAELIEAPPDYLKFDISLVRNIDDATPERIRLMQSLVRMVRDLGIIALAEGIETAGEANTCKELGFETAQGYFYGRPRTAG